MRNTYKRYKALAVLEKCERKISYISVETSWQILFTHIVSIWEVVLVILTPNNILTFQCKQIVDLIRAKIKITAVKNIDFFLLNKKIYL